MNPKKVLTTAGLIVALGGVVANTTAFSIKCNQLDEKIVDVRQELEEVDGATRRELLEAINTTRAALEAQVASVNSDLTESIATVRSTVSSLETALKAVDEKLAAQLHDAIEAVYSEIDDVEYSLYVEQQTRITNDNTLATQIQQKYQAAVALVGQLETKVTNLVNALNAKDAELNGLIGDNADAIVEVNNKLTEAKTSLLQMINDLQAQIDDVKERYATKVLLEEVKTNLEKAISDLEDYVKDNYYTKTEVDAIKLALQTEYKQLIEALKATCENGTMNDDEAVNKWKGFIEITSDLATHTADIKAINDKLDAFNGEAAMKAKAEYAGKLAYASAELIYDFIGEVDKRVADLLEDASESSVDALFKAAYEDQSFEDLYGEAIDTMIKHLKLQRKEIEKVEDEGTGYVLLAKDVTEAKKYYDEYLARLQGSTFEAQYTLQQLEDIVDMIQLSNLVDDHTGYFGDYEACRTALIAVVEAHTWDKTTFETKTTGVEQKSFFDSEMNKLEAQFEAAKSYDKLIEDLEKLYDVSATKYGTDYIPVETEISKLAQDAVKFDNYKTAVAAATSKTSLATIVEPFTKELARVQKITDRYIEVLTANKTNTTALDSLDPLKQTANSADKEALAATFKKYTKVADMTAFATAGSLPNTSATEASKIIDAMLAAQVLDAHKASKYNEVLKARDAAVKAVNDETGLCDDAKKAFVKAINGAVSVSGFLTKSDELPEGKTEVTKETIDTATAAYILNGVTDYKRIALEIEKPLEKAIADARADIKDNGDSTTVNKHLLTDQRTYLNSITDLIEKTFTTYTGTGESAAVRTGLTFATATTEKETSDRHLHNLGVAISQIDGAQARVNAFNSDVKALKDNFFDSWIAAGHSNKANTFAPQHVDDGKTVAATAQYETDLGTAYTAAGGGAKTLATLPVVGTDEAAAVAAMVKYVLELPTQETLNTIKSTFATALAGIQTTMDEDFATREAAYMTSLKGLVSTKLTEMYNKVKTALAGDIAKLDQAQSIDNTYQDALANKLQSSDAAVTLFNQARAAYLLISGIDSGDVLDEAVYYSEPQE